jgi:hypothetical protein
MKFQLFVTFCISVVALVISGLAYNHIHWAVGLGLVGAFAYGIVRYRHKLFPGM